MYIWRKAGEVILRNDLITLIAVLVIISISVLATFGIVIMGGIIISLIFYPNYDIHTGCLNNITIFNATICPTVNDNVCYLDKPIGIVSGCGLFGTIGILTTVYAILFIRTIYRIFYRAKTYRQVNISCIDTMKMLFWNDLINQANNNHIQNYNSYDSYHDNEYEMHNNNKPDYMIYDTCDQLIIYSIIGAFILVVVWLISVIFGIIVTWIIYGRLYDIRENTNLFCNLSNPYNVFVKCFMFGLLPDSLIVMIAIIIAGYYRMQYMESQIVAYQQSTIQ